MSLHLDIEGRWLACRVDSVTCPLPYHLPLTDPAVAASAAEAFLEPLLNTVDPPDRVVQGRQLWYRAGSLHRDYGLPAYVAANRDRLWYRRGRLHRGQDLPAVHFTRLEAGTVQAPNVTDPTGNAMLLGTQEWWVDGGRHRAAGPAVIHEHTGFEAWYLHGVLHRPGQLPAVTWADGRVEYWEYGHQLPPRA